jgi:hypothetical protein
MHLNTRRHQHVRSFEAQTQFKVFFCSYSLPAAAPSTRTRSTQYVGRWWHHDSAVATVNPCLVSVPVLYQCSRLNRPVSVVSNLCSNSSCPCVSNLSNLFMCVQGAWDLPFWQFLTMFQHASIWWTNMHLHSDAFLPTSSRVFQVSISQLRHSPFLLGLFWGLPRSHRLSDHSRLNAFVIQTN